jgi:hypothetical protein
MSELCQGLLFVGLMLLIPVGIAAQTSTDTNRPHFDLTPLSGYRTSVSLPLDPAVQGSNAKMIFDSDPSYGFAAGMRFHDEDVIEFRWARQDSNTHLEGSNLIALQQKVTLDQYHGDFTHEYILYDWPDWARPFVIGSVGATHISGRLNTHFTRFSFGLGGGIKFFVGKHFGFRMQAEWLPIVVNPHAAFYCGGGCVIHIGGTIGSQGEVIAGPLLRF